MQTGVVFFFSSVPTALAANQAPAQGMQLGEKKKPKLYNLWNVFLLLRASALPCLGERLPWLALAASSCQWGFLSCGLQLDFGQRLLGRGRCI